MYGYLTPPGKIKHKKYGIEDGVYVSHIGGCTCSQ